jgi:hypothetical protein
LEGSIQGEGHEPRKIVNARTVLDKFGRFKSESDKWYVAKFHNAQAQD